eukprot:scaffold17427_cov54-Cylindrotheca_fusiformis.AAC.2
MICPDTMDLENFGVLHDWNQTFSAECATREGKYASHLSPSLIHPPFSAAGNSCKAIDPFARALSVQRMKFAMLLFSSRSFWSPPLLLEASSSRLFITVFRILDQHLKVFYI